MKLIVLLIPFIYQFICCCSGSKYDFLNGKNIFQQFRDRFRGRCRIPRDCGIKLLTEERSQHCIAQRKRDVAISRIWYKITDKNSTIEFPLRAEVPFLDQKYKDVQYFYAINEDEGRYLMLFTTWGSIASTNGRLEQTLGQYFGGSPVQTFQKHATIYKTTQQIIQSVKTPQYFGNPAMGPDFTDHVTNGYWRTDDAFVQRRIAGLCPFMLRKVTEKVEGRKQIGYDAMELAKRLNKNVLNAKFLVDIGNGKKISLVKAIEEERLFVLYHEWMDSYPTSADLTDRNVTDNRIQRNLSSPISLYILKDDGILSVFAIQWNSSPDANVYLPSSPTLQWEIAKAQVELTSDIYCQATYHLGGVHFTYTVFCLAYKRHFSKQHPLYDFFKHHCEGTTPHISLSYNFLAAENSVGDKLFALGNEGFVDLSLKEFQAREYGHYDYNVLIKERGLDDIRIKYFPFRDDAILILREFQIFANKVVNLYYKNCDEDDNSDEAAFNNNHKSYEKRSKNNDLNNEEAQDKQDTDEDTDLSVISDPELQSFANEVSIDGTGEDGGKGKFKKFPAKFRTKRQLKQFLVRFLWYNVIHTSVNYPLAPEFVPVQVGKVYTRKSGEITKLEELYPGYGYGEQQDVIGSIAGRVLLSGFRANRLLSYFDKANDKRFRQIVWRSYYRLHNCVQKKLQKRNAERKKKNQLGYQYLEPKWITSSVHI